MTGQPQTDDELTNAVQEANKSITDDVPEDVKNHPLTKDSLKDDKMNVEDFNGETMSYTKDEWENARSTRTRLWASLERRDGSYVKVAHWFTDEDVNAVKIEDGFYGEKVDETEKAYKFVCETNAENHTAESREVWIPKKAARVHTLK